MVAFTNIVIDGVIDVVDALFGATKDAAKKHPKLKEAVDRSSSERRRAPTEQARESARAESIDETSGVPSPGAEKVFNPRVMGALRNVYADYRFNQYEKKGLLAECFRQREERLKGQEDE